MYMCISLFGLPGLLKQVSLIACRSQRYNQLHIASYTKLKKQKA